MKNPDFTQLREAMVREQIAKRGITNPDLLRAFMDVPRHSFVLQEEINFAYEDHPLPVGEGQTISQPYIVALMTEALKVRGGDKILEVGTGSGYQAAILAQLGTRVFSIERIPSLARQAQALLSSLGYHVTIDVGDGTCGWQEYAPYDRIIVTAASPAISPLWEEQLIVGGRMVVPVGSEFSQELVVVDKVSATHTKSETLGGCVFVPLIGKYGFAK